ncbi:NAD(P)-dependent dehydrogenase (short-subunit alcohol dehydrogenase family) [Stella humosa]|uniref:NAD(P)-dependent dehydrogenase (Short-subunit alcohol dehydrogenase family) n=1 Tax=Stella humosa TaxID=94 RepID=A0A3N1L210_9PROT|nr:SDR family oxidoreductase [Stella humosa]ROP83555.1 NAD(P)-dependent dehydrogenase (short-subunit alcohol dehydrogenase family) [Stella humosa]BBK33173.1 oxidoreductase [Stella humosa]
MAPSRTILITGASRGIGLAAAHHFAAAGHQVIGVARSAVPAGFPGRFHSLDLAADDFAEKIAAVTAATPVDVLINNAGAGRMAHLGTVKLEDFDAIVRLNLTATLLATRACLPHMRAQGWGRVVNVASRAALGKDGRTVYGATKAGLFGFTRTWALELAAEGVTVNCVAPGPIETEMFREHNQPGSPTAQTVIGAIPVKRMGQPEEVVSALAFFAGEHAGFTTGQVLYVCGGLTVARDPI